jgi:hypothetical protein
MDLPRTSSDAFVTSADVAGAGSALRVIRLAASALAALIVAVGLLALALADGSIEVSLPARAPLTLGDQVQNVAAAQFGPTLRASSAFASDLLQHHPAFVVDGRRRPTDLEKWASRAEDRAPWIEVLFPRPVHLQRVVLTHGGAVEAAEYTADTFRLRCIRADGKPAEWLSVTGNRRPKTTHTLDCEQARGVRLELTPRADDIVRLYEIEAFGQ